MGQIRPIDGETGGSLFTFVLPATQVPALKSRLQREAGDHPLVCVEQRLLDGLIRLVVIATSLTPTQRGRIEALQHDENATRRRLAADFDVALRFE